MWLIVAFLAQEGHRNLIDWEELSSPIGFGMGCLFATAVELRIGHSKVFQLACLFVAILGSIGVTYLAIAASSRNLDGIVPAFILIIIGYIGAVVAGLSLVLAIAITLVRAWLERRMLQTNNAG